MADSAGAASLQQYKRYPGDAQSRAVQLSFTVDRTGQTAATVPASMPQAKLDLTVPIRFSLQ